MSGAAWATVDHDSSVDRSESLANPVVNALGYLTLSAGRTSSNASLVVRVATSNAISNLVAGTGWGSLVQVGRQLGHRWFHRAARSPHGSGAKYGLLGQEAASASEAGRRQGGSFVCLPRGWSVLSSTSNAIAKSCREASNDEPDVLLRSCHLVPSRGVQHPTSAARVRDGRRGREADLNHVGHRNRLPTEGRGRA